MSLTNRYGTPLLSLTTTRPPDSNRGTGIVHLDLAIPDVISSEIARADSGARGPVDPREAAQLLWSVPAATYVRGKPDDWLDTPGVRWLLPGLTALEEVPTGQWPKNQAALKTFLAEAAPGGPTTADWTTALKDAGTVSLLNDLVLIFKYAAVGTRRPLRTVASVFRLAMASTAQSDRPNSRDAVIAWLNAPLVVPRVFTGPLARSPARPTTPPADGGGSGGGGRPKRPDVSFVSLNTPSGADIIRRLDTEISDLERRAREMALGDALRAEGIRDPAVISRLSRAVGTGSAELRPSHAEPERLSSDAPPVLLNRSAFPATQRTQKLVRTYIAGFPAIIDVAEAEVRVGGVRHMVAQRLAELLPGNFRDRLTALEVSLDSLQLWPDILHASVQSPSYLEPVGRSDLLIIRQTTTGYRRAEIAYVENVLVGETRDRQHTQRLTTRREVFERAEREQEETRDLQTTDRSELNREISSLINEDLRAQGSVEVTSRGPTKVVASAATSFDRSTEEAAKTVEEYARETVERAVKRTLERITREVRSLVEQEMLEVNRHTFTRDSNASDHVSGLYQYLERVSRAKIFWYGERELYDLLIPEPAALIWQLAISRKELHNPLERPDAELFSSLTVANIAEKREAVIRAFRVTDMPDLPEERRQLSMPFSPTGSGDSAKYAKSEDLQIPEGYEVVSGFFGVSVEVEDSDDKPNGGWAAGNLVDSWSVPSLVNNQGTFAKDFTFPTPQAGPTIAVAMHADNFTSLAGSITLDLQLTQKARDAWALDAYGRVAERYEQLRREYEQTVIQLTAGYQDEVTNLPEASRLRLQQIVRFELQRAAIDIMRNVPVNFDMISDYPFANSDGSLGVHPIADLTALHVSEPEVRFLQQAFEWEHMSWVLYPYFWGRRSEWKRTVVQTHADPDFEAFLNAGAARLQISVRPGFEQFVKHFMETGEAYSGNGLPQIGDPGYVSFIDEQMTSLGAPGEEVPWPPDAPREWNVVAPTPLIVARSLTKPPLPTWNADTGEEEV